MSQERGHEAESAAALMSALYRQLDDAGVAQHDALQILTGLLTQLFSDDAGASADQYPLELVGLPRLPDTFRDTWLRARALNWSEISPTVFGSMFEAVKTKQARRRGGEHYTVEANILKTIRPLFLTRYRDRFAQAGTDTDQLVRLHQEIAQLQFLDPACGCGNFLVVALRELRALELDILRRLRGLGMPPAVAALVSVDQFFGIEIDEWPARIAKIAMLLADQQANQQLALEFGASPGRPSPAAHIHQGNALEIDWNTVLPPSSRVIVFGNPPFAGHKQRTAEQTADLRSAWGRDYNGNLDYVTAWFRKACEYLTSPRSRFAFVATSSICQGQSVAPLWGPVLESGWTVYFAHRPFIWDSESASGAGVHVVIVGLARERLACKLFDYPADGRGQPTARSVDKINAYLLNGPDVVVRASRKPVSDHLPALSEGNKLWDFGHLVIAPEHLSDFRADPVASRFVRPLLSNTTLLKGKPRWVLWLRDADPADWAGCALIEDRLRLIGKLRAASSDAEANNMASTPQLFTNYRQPTARYLAIPKVTGHARIYLPAAYSTPDVVVNNTLFTAPDDDGFIFAVISSRIFAIWQRLVGGHTRADSNFSNTLVWNTFPIPAASGDFRSLAADAGSAILAARKAFADKTLEELYDDAAMPNQLRSAHRNLDAVVGRHLGVDVCDVEQCEIRLLSRYADMCRAQSEFTATTADRSHPTTTSPSPQRPLEHPRPHQD